MESIAQAKKVFISIHSPRMGRDNICRRARSTKNEFQSTLPAWGETIIKGIDEIRPYEFQSTLPAWGETKRWGSSRSGRRFQSTLPAWGETNFVEKMGGSVEISIHSPRMGRDKVENNNTGWRFLISIHSPRMGRDGSNGKYSFIYTISIHSPRMGRDGGFIPVCNALLISIHSPRMGRDFAAIFS